MKTTTSLLSTTNPNHLLLHLLPIPQNLPVGLEPAVIRLSDELHSLVGGRAVKTSGLGLVYEVVKVDFGRRELFERPLRDVGKERSQRVFERKGSEGDFTAAR